MDATRHLRRAAARTGASALAAWLCFAAAPAFADDGAAEATFTAQVDAFFSTIVATMAKVLFFPVFKTDDVAFPFIVAVLVFGGLFFTVTMRFINLRGFRHAFFVVRGHYDNPNEPGEVTHFQALSAALSATVGLGNIAGVAIAVSKGGPGAVFWMVMAGFLGMSSKFVEVTLGQKYRKVLPDGSVSGGAMHYLEDGLAKRGMAPLGKVLGVLFAILCVGGSLGGGNMFQANQSGAAMAGQFPWLADNLWIYGLVLSFLVGMVIIGGIKRIGQVADKIVPAMCGLYLVAGFIVLLVNFDKIGWALSHIISEAFSPDAAIGGAIGVLIIGFQRAAFSNEAGVGSAPIAHAAAKTDEPVREGMVALLEPFIDTIVVCTMTGLVVTVTGVYAAADAKEGVELTSQAFASVISWFPLLLSFAVVLFAYSTMISWSYYGERCWTYLWSKLLGEQAAKASTLAYKVLFCVAVFVGSVVNLGAVLDFSDMMILSMAVPNILGLVLLAPEVRRDLADYLGRLASGAMKTYK